MKYFRFITFLVWCLTVVSPYVVPKKGGRGSTVHDREHSWPPVAYDSGISQPNDAEDLNCRDYFELLSDTIVRTKDSLKAGANFISAPNVETEDQCLEQCLCDLDVETDYCDMAVFEAKNKSCYLFNCVIDDENMCLFAHHEGYASMVYNLKSFKKGKQAAEHADDLEDLKDDDDDNMELEDGDEDDISEPGPVSKVHTTTATTTTTTTQSSKIECTRYEFECDNGDCIGIYLACDDIPHCLDKSDEKGCQYDSSDAWYYYNKDNKEDEYEYKSYEYEEPEDSPTTTTTQQPVKHHKDHDGEVTESIAPTMSKTDMMNGGTSVEKRPDIPTPVLGSEELTQSIPNKENNATNNIDDDINIIDEIDVLEMIVEPGRTAPETSVILPLAIGLAITLVLLVMVACRLRMVKRKLRYSRPLANSQEADYLINGMYL